MTKLTLRCPADNTPLVWKNERTRSAICPKCKHPYRTKTRYTIDGDFPVFAAKSGPKNGYPKTARLNAKTYQHIVDALAAAGFVGGQAIFDAGIEALRQKLGLTFVAQ